MPRRCTSSEGGEGNHPNEKKKEPTVPLADGDIRLEKKPRFLKKGKSGFKRRENGLVPRSDSKEAHLKLPRGRGTKEGDISYQGKKRRESKEKKSKKKLRTYQRLRGGHQLARSEEGMVV